MGADADPVFFPGEVVDLLGLQGVSYETLRRLHAIIRASVADPPSAPGDRGGGWARYTAADVARLDLLVELCGGRSALVPGRRLNMRGVAEACAALIGLGSADPLLEVPMARIGAKVVAVLDGFVFEPQTGQAVIAVAGAGPPEPAWRSRRSRAVLEARSSARLSRRQETELAQAAKRRAGLPLSSVDI